jgi:RNA polymerase sigma-70 factor (ECF subfamily)
MAIEAGNHGWCEQLYRAKASVLVLYGRSLGLSHGEAEDVLQETFAALLRLTEEPEQAGHYVVRAYRNRALNQRRGWWRRLTRELESARWFEQDPGESPQERAAMKCLADLPAEQRETIVLKLWHGLTFEGIGQLTGVSPHTAAGRYRYGLAKLRSCLKGNLADEDQPEWEPGRDGDGIAFLETPLSLPGH